MTASKRMALTFCCMLLGILSFGAWGTIPTVIRYGPRCALPVLQVCRCKDKWCPLEMDVSGIIDRMRRMRSSVKGHKYFCWAGSLIGVVRVFD